MGSAGATHADVEGKYIVLSSYLVLMLMQVFQHVTKMMSHSCQPLVADAIPLINLLDEQLKVLVGNSKQPMIICASAAKGCAVLNKYYSKTDDSKMYQLSMSMYLCSVLWALTDS